MPELRLTRRAREQLETLPDKVRDAVLETLVLIQLEPEDMGKRLVGRMAGLWSARAGNYRILYTVEPTGVIVRSIRHRGVAYRPRRRRR
ncbi:MAG TPA: type II toxin-antitoxin system RelE/ParE family toxin [Gaiellaceae bacterium]|nr:type II toxin-antitoxin system RelE/ParE family toxin [Gaiellaceae bacterium]